MLVTVVTPTLPSRGRWLVDCITDVAAQTEPAHHLIEVDTAREGPSKLRNRMVRAARTDWVAFVDDDDRITPNHLAVLLAHAERADVVYSLGAVTGRDWDIPHDCHLTHLDQVNTIPVTTLVRRHAFLDVGGFGEARNEDHDLWLRMRRNQARFQCVHEVTWLYQFHGSNRSLGGA